VLFAEITQQVVNGLTLAAIYALIAVGVSLFFGTIGVVNLAHGDVAIFGAFSAIIAQKVLAAPAGPFDPTLAALLSIPVGIVVGAIVGWALYQFAFRSLADSPPVVGLLAAIAAGLIIREAIFAFFPDGRNPQIFTSFVPTVAFEIWGVFLLLSQMFVIVVSILVVVILAGIIRGTKFGRAVRSIVNDREVARTLGVPVEKTVAITFLLGGALGGIAGLLNGAYYNVLQFDTGVMLTVKGFVAAVIGGLGNIYGALIGAIIVGLLESFTVGFIPAGSAYKEVVVFGALTVILVLRPEGILGHGAGQKA
jgi:branched-chain amino acid transport system permease protein